MTRRKSSWAKAIFSLAAFVFGSARNRPVYRRRLLLEALEDRCVPTTITPTTFADGGLGSGSLRDAILQFNADTGTDDDTIQLLPGTYSLTILNVGGQHETAGLTGDLNLTQTSHHWIIQGAGPSTVIDAGQLQDRAFQIVTPGTQVVFKDLVIQGGLAQEDGSNGALAGSTDAVGGGILNNGGAVTLDHVVVQNNMAGHGDYGTGHNAQGGGIFATDGSLSVSNSTIASNQAVGDHGASDRDYLGGDGGAGAGGGIFTTGGTISLTKTTVSGNTVRGGDGGYPTGAGGAGAGGGIYTIGGTMSLTNTTVSKNTVRGGDGGYGGNAFSSGGGTGGDGLGGGVYASGGMLTITKATISTNTVTGGSGGRGGSCLTGAGGTGGTGGAGLGGGVYASGGTLSLANTTLSTNTVQGGNGGNGGPAIFSYPGGIGGDGGAASGGGIYDNSGTCAVTSCTLALNTAKASKGGAGGSGVPQGNPGTGQSGLGGGVRNAGGTLNALNTIFSDNIAASDPDLYGSLSSAGYNLIGNSSGGSGYADTDLLDVDAKLGPLQDNGGPAKTMALLAGSPALNAGDSAQRGVADERGVVRTGGVNIGAYQASASAFVLTAPATATAGTPFDLTVNAVDPFGQTALGYTGTVHFSSTDGQAVLPSNYTFTLNDHGLHAYSGGVALKTAGNQTITATDTVTSSITGSASVTVNPAAADHLLFLQQPTDTGAGQTITPAVTVAVVDQFGNVVTSDNSDTVTLTLGTNPSGGRLSGTLTVTVRGGIATFADLSIDLAGVGYTLHATASGLLDAVSGVFSIM
jgi:hypothetical protein